MELIKTMLEIVMKAVLNTTSVKTKKNVKKFYVHLEMILLVWNVIYNFNTVRRLKNGTPVFDLFLYEILIKFDTQWQF